MKLKLTIVNYQSIEQPEDLAELIPIDYDDCPTEEMIFYNVDAIKPLTNKYTLLTLAGYEYVIKLPCSKLEKLIDKSKHIIINEN